ncbi:MAG: sugar transferase, partial [Tannerellaceae bacterium]
IFSLIGILLCIPFFILIPIFIKCDSHGPIFFKQKRIGLNGKVFNIYKFRTMVVDAEYMDMGLFNTADDPRVTKVGRILRDTSLDEIPQFINILFGTMSFVGPRPPVTYELGDYAEWNELLKLSFSVKPGVTGLAQVNGRNELNWDQKTEYNVKYIDYVKKYGLLIDIYIVFLTIYKVLRNEGGYELPENISKDKMKVISDSKSKSNE